MPPRKRKSEHVIGDCISRFAITIVMLADGAAMKQYVQAYDREAHPASCNSHRHGCIFDNDSYLRYMACVRDCIASVTCMRILLYSMAELCVPFEFIVLYFLLYS